MHGMAAVFVQEARIDKDEAAALARGIAAVNAHYDKVINPKIVAWVNLASVGAAIYGPRVVAFGMRKKMERDKKRPVSRLVQNTPAPVTPINPAPPQNATQKESVVPRPAPVPPAERAMMADPAFVPDLTEM